MDASLPAPDCERQPEPPASRKSGSAAILRAVSGRTTDTRPEPPSLHLPPRENPHASLTDAVVEVVGIPEHLNRPARREHEMLIDDERRGCADTRGREDLLAVSRGRSATALAFALAGRRRARAQAAVAV